MTGWRPTVAAIIERNGRFLVVEETDGVHPERVFNQPAGHVDPGETILEAVVRETLEETGLAFTPQAFMGIYHLKARNGRDYLRTAIIGTVPEGQEPAPRDPVILGCRWLTRDEIAERPRSTVVLACIDHYLQGIRQPLALVEHVYTER